jgi:hypothetical protein
MAPRGTTIESVYSYRRAHAPPCWLELADTTGPCSTHIYTQCTIYGASIATVETHIELCVCAHTRVTRIRIRISLNPLSALQLGHDRRWQAPR